MTGSLMVQGTSSGAGKTTLVAALCRIFSDMGYSVAPFKSQNMSGFSYAGSGFEISRAQAVQAVAARCEITPDLNPVLLKPTGGGRSAVFLNGRRHGTMRAREYYAGFATSAGLRAAAASLARLRGSHDLVVLEGAGSPAEINLQRWDIANMRMAARARAPVILVADVDRGGAFAGLAGTLALVEGRHRGRVRGFVFNKFRGDASVLRPGFRKLRRITGVPVLGTVPLMDLRLPEEDSLGGGPRRMAWSRRNVSRVDREVGRLAKTVKESLDIGTIEGMIGW